MKHQDDQLFKNATQIAERSIRIARSHQSREVASVVVDAAARVVSLFGKMWSTAFGGRLAMRGAHGRGE